MLRVGEKMATKSFTQTPNAYNLLKTNTTFLFSLCGSSRCSLRFYKYFCRGRRLQPSCGRFFYCGQYGSFAVFAVYLRFPAVLCGLNRISGKVVNALSCLCVYNFDE